MCLDFNIDKNQKTKVQKILYFTGHWITVRLRRPVIHREPASTPVTGGCLRQPRRFSSGRSITRITVRLRRPVIHREPHPPLSPAAAFVSHAGFPPAAPLPGLRSACGVP